jgi:hypothetical protein
LIPSPSVHDVVVSRRDDGREVLRIPAEDPLLAGDTLAVVRDQLERVDADTFLADWALTTVCWRAAADPARRGGRPR